ncbi:hypothetical protein Ciccas_013189 [Cichlidogyrus casuarinus]|uniref:Uncharacterized protein n=1 Tax=Cichlidogyrus casuarinus TaxID=1844966 RepID=A0ABD2PL79_9PLAT
MDGLVTFWARPLGSLLRMLSHTANVEFTLDLDHFWELASGDYQAHWVSRAIYAFNTPWLVLFLLVKILLIIIVPIIFLNLLFIYTVQLYSQQSPHTNVVEHTVKLRNGRRNPSYKEGRLFALTFIVLIVLLGFAWIAIFANSALYQAVVHRTGDGNNMVSSYEAAIYQLRDIVERSIESSRFDENKIFRDLYTSLHGFTEQLLVQIHHDVLRDIKYEPVIQHCDNLARDLIKMQLLYAEMKSGYSTTVLAKTLEAIHSFFVEHGSRMDEQSAVLQEVCPLEHNLQPLVKQLRISLRTLKRGLYADQMGRRSISDLLAVSEKESTFEMPQLDFLKLTQNATLAGHQLAAATTSYIFSEFERDFSFKKKMPTRAIEGMRFMWNSYIDALKHLFITSSKLIKPDSLSSLASWILKLQLWLIYVPLILLGVGKLVFLCLPYAELENSSEVITVEDYGRDFDLEPPRLKFRSKTTSSVRVEVNKMNKQRRKVILAAVFNIVFLLILLVDSVTFVGVLTSVYLETKVSVQHCAVKCMYSTS